MVMGRTYARDDHGRFASTGSSNKSGRYAGEQEFDRLSHAREVRSRSSNMPKPTSDPRNEALRRRIAWVASQSKGGSGGGGGKPKVNTAKYNATRGSMPRQRTSGGNPRYEPPKADPLKNPMSGLTTYKRTFPTRGNRK